MANGWGVFDLRLTATFGNSGRPEQYGLTAHAWNGDWQVVWGMLP